MAVKQGWTGRVYEDFEVGDIYQHPLGRTVLPVDNSWFTLLTQNVNPRDRWLIPHLRWRWSPASRRSICR
jgi:hypothetical protein